MAFRAGHAPLRPLALAAAAALGAALAVAGCQSRPGGETREPGTPAATTAAPDPVARGQYLVNAMGCDDCHTPQKLGPNGLEPDLERRLSGHPASLVLPPPPALGDGPWMWCGTGTLTAFSGPWGITYTPNLTPHETTGLAVWTEDMFIQAMRTGRHMGTSRPIMPPMPWRYYGNLNDDDLKAIFAFLRTVPPVENLVPDYAPPPGAAPPAGTD
jgi:hypothetical protein